MRGSSNTAVPTAAIAKARRRGSIIATGSVGIDNAVPKPACRIMVHFCSLPRHHLNVEHRPASFYGRISQRHDQVYGFAAAFAAGAGVSLTRFRPFPDEDEALDGQP